MRENYNGYELSTVWDDEALGLDCIKNSLTSASRNLSVQDTNLSSSTPAMPDSRALFPRIRLTRIKAPLAGISLQHLYRRGL